MVKKEKGIGLIKGVISSVLILMFPLVFIGKGICSNYGASMYFNYYGYPSFQGNRYDGRLTGYIQGPFIGTTSLLLRSGFYGGNAEGYESPYYQPNFFLSLNGRRFSTDWRYGALKFQRNGSGRSRRDNLDGNLSLLLQGLPKFVLSYADYRSKYDNESTLERDYRVLSRYLRGPLSLRYSSWRRNLKRSISGSKNLLRGENYGGQLSMAPLPTMGIFLNYDLYKERQITDNLTRELIEERVVTGLKGYLTEEIRSDLTFTLLNNRRDSIRDRRGNLLLSIWMNPKQNLNVYFSSSEKVDLDHGNAEPGRLSSFGLLWKTDFFNLTQSFRYNLRLNKLQGLPTSWYHIGYWRISGDLRGSMKFDTYFHISRQWIVTKNINNVEVDATLYGPLSERVYVYLRGNRGYRGGNTLNLREDRASIYFNGSFRLLRSNKFTLDYVANEKPNLSYQMNCSLFLSKGTTMLVFNYSRTDAGTMKFWKSGESPLQSYGISFRIVSNSGGTLTVTYWVTEVRGLIKDYISVKTAWRLQ